MTTNNFEGQLAIQLLTLYNEFLIGNIDIDKIKKSFTYRNWKNNYSALARVKSTICLDKDMEFCATIKELLAILDKKYIDQSHDLKYLHLDYVNKVTSIALFKDSYKDRVTTKFLQIYNAYLLGLIDLDNIKRSTIYQTWKQANNGHVLASLLKHNPDIDAIKAVHVTLSNFDQLIINSNPKVEELMINVEDDNEMRR